MIDIPVNQLLHGGEPTMDLEKALFLHASMSAATIAAGDARTLEAEIRDSDFAANLSHMTQDNLREVFRIYGGGGLYRLIYLASSHPTSEFDHFFGLIRNELTFRSSGGLLGRLLGSLHKTGPLVSDNETLRAGSEMDRLNSHIIQPSLSRKLYNPGTHPGYLVYGLGGPRILVSHPFRGARDEFYDVYENSVDVVTSLIMRGYFGAFLFLDYLGGMNRGMSGLPQWLLWFSLIATHSDLVVFVRGENEELRQSQRREIAVTPDRVHKKVIELGSTELRWAKEHNENLADFEWIVIDDGELISREEEYKRHAEHSYELVESYTDPSLPRDRLFVLEESGGVRALPAAFDAYVE